MAVTYVMKKTMTAHFMSIIADLLDTVREEFCKITGNKIVWEEENIMTAPDAFMLDNFGGSIGISGGTILVGADNQDLKQRNSNIGAAYVYRIGTPTP